MSELFDLDRQAAHLFKHDPYGIADIYEIWNSDPLFYPANQVSSDRLLRRRQTPR